MRLYTSDLVENPNCLFSHAQAQMACVHPHCMVKRNILINTLLGNGCSLSLQYVLFVLVPHWQFIFAHLGFQSGTFVLIMPFPGHCFHLPFYSIRRTILQMSHCIRKPTICLCENKAADQPCNNCTADQRLGFRSIDSFNTSSS